VQPDDLYLLVLVSERSHHLPTLVPTSILDQDQLVVAFDVLKGLVNAFRKLT